MVWALDRCFEASWTEDSLRSWGALSSPETPCNMDQLQTSWIVSAWEASKTCRETMNSHEINLRASALLARSSKASLHSLALQSPGISPEPLNYHV